MTAAERVYMDLASRVLDYPDTDFFTELPSLRLQAEALPESQAKKDLQDFINNIEQAGTWASQQKYVAVFDHNPDTSLYLAWHRYGNDRGQGKALAALNGLYRAAGLEPVYGSMPDYLPRMLEFMAISEDWAIEVMLDGFGSEINRLIENLVSQDPWRAKILSSAFEPLRDRWPEYFKPRAATDATIRPMARPEPETPLLPPFCSLSSSGGQED